ncbi:MAG: SDR family NAD(P)-dependent oxidoreductase [Promethearchaeota archaeon]
MIKNFEGKVAVVTGGGSGIGLSLAHAFAKRDMKIVLADINKRSLNKASRRISKRGTEVLSLIIDVSDPKQVEELANAAYDRFGKVNILCNNAGVGSSGPVHLLEIGNWTHTLGTNLFGVIYGIKFFLKRMLDSKEPCHIVNTASIAGHLTEQSGPYAASKFAVVSISETLALQCFNTNVGASVLCPGFVKTKILENTFLLSTDHTNFYQPSPEEAEASLPFIENVSKISRLGMNPDIVAEMVIYAIQNDLLYIMTHPQYTNLIKDRFNRIKNDTLKINERFPTPIREIKENHFKYNSESFVFSISYPDYLVQINPDPNTSQVFLATSIDLLKSLTVSVSEMDPAMRLEDSMKAIVDFLKSLGKNIKIISDKQITLSDGNVAREGEIEYQNRGFEKILSHHISILKDKKWIRVSIYTHPSYFTNDLKKIGYSLKFEVPLAEVQ